MCIGSRGERERLRAGSSHRHIRPRSDFVRPADPPFTCTQTHSRYANELGPKSTPKFGKRVPIRTLPAGHWTDARRRQLLPPIRWARFHRNDLHLDYDRTVGSRRKEERERKKNSVKLGKTVELSEEHGRVMETRPNPTVPCAVVRNGSRTRPFS